MTRSSESKLAGWLGKLAPKGVLPREVNLRDPRVSVRLAIGVLLLANVVAVVQVIYPFGGSPEQLQDELASLEAQQARGDAQLAAIQGLARKIERGKKEGDEFLVRYFLPRRTASSILQTELLETAKAAGIKPKAHQFTMEPIEGSDTLTLLTITGNYEGTYSNLVHFLNALDRADRLMIIDSMAASPTNTAEMLNVNLKIHAFIQDDGSLPPPPPAEGEDQEGDTAVQRQKVSQGG